MEKTLSIETRRYLERELKDYKENKKMIEELRNDIIEASPKITLGVPRGSNKGNENITNKVYKLMSNNQISRLEHIFNKIEKVLEKLNDTQYEFYIRYFEKGQSKVKICLEMPISERTHERYKKRIIYYLAEELGFL